MKVKILKPFVLHNGSSFSTGEVADLPESDARPLVKAGFAAKASASDMRTVAAAVIETREE